MLCGGLADNARGGGRPKQPKADSGVQRKERRRRRERSGEGRERREGWVRSTPLGIPPSSLLLAPQPPSLARSLPLSLLCQWNGWRYNSLQMYTAQHAATTKTTTRAISHGVTTPRLILERRKDVGTTGSTRAACACCALCLTALHVGWLVGWLGTLNRQQYLTTTAKMQSPLVRSPSLFV